jgi:hypothetical protein
MAVTVLTGGLVTMDANADEHFFWRGDYQIITRLNGGTASLQVRFEGGNATPSVFDGGTLADNSKLLTFSDSYIKLVKTGAAFIEINKVSAG